MCRCSSWRRRLRRLLQSCCSCRCSCSCWCGYSRVGCCGDEEKDVDDVCEESKKVEVVSVRFAAAQIEKKCVVESEARLGCKLLLQMDEFAVVVVVVVVVGGVIEKSCLLVAERQFCVGPAIGLPVDDETRSSKSSSRS